MTEPVTERKIVRASGIISPGPDGKPIWPPQVDLPALVGPEQVYRELPADETYWSDAARAKAEGWQVPLPELDESILMREAFRQAVEAFKARRNPDPGRLHRATKHAADLTLSEQRIARAEIVEVLIDLAADAFCAVNLGVDWSTINSWSMALYQHWLNLLHKNQRAVLQSLLGRDTPSCNRLRAQVERMSLSLAPPSAEAERAVYMVMP